jgi:hypothetical protein
MMHRRGVEDQRYPLYGNSRDIDVHELMKQEAFGISKTPCNTQFGKNRPCPLTTYGISDQYIVLDSFSKLASSNIENGEFQWNFMIQGVTSDDVIGVRDVIDTVIEIQIGSFAMPILEEVPYDTKPLATDISLEHNNNAPHAPADKQSPALVNNTFTSGIMYGQYNPQLLVPPSTILSPWVNNPYTQTPFFGRFTIQIREVGLQSYSDRNGVRHSFEFTQTLPPINSNPNMLLAIPQWDKFTFTDPLKDIHGLTLIFRNPDIPLNFLPDVYYNIKAGIDGNGYLQFEINNHKLNTGDRIFITGFKSGISQLDSFINRIEGLVAADSPSSTATAGKTIMGNHIWTDPAVAISSIASIDVSMINNNVFNKTVTVYIAKRRIRIPMRLRRVVDRLTNYIAP